MHQEFINACYYNNLKRAKVIYNKKCITFVDRCFCHSGYTKRHVDYKSVLFNAKLRGNDEIYKWLKCIPREIYVFELISKLDKFPFYENPMFDLNIFTNVIWSYLFNKN